MPRFFIDTITENPFSLTGPAAAHVVKSLRMRPGERLTLCDQNQLEYDCAILKTSPDAVLLEVGKGMPSRSEPSLRVTLYQGVPKADKMELIIQKAVELGVERVVPVETARCVSRPDPKAARKKAERWQKIAEEAAKQSGRGKVPQVAPPLSFVQALLEGAQSEKMLLFYEGGGRPVGQLVPADTRTAAIFVGPEGGFSSAEVEAAIQAGAAPATLGPRILRTETAPLAALSVLMYVTGNLE